MKTLLDYINEANFLVKGKIQKQSNYDAVDLGLSVKWATCNVGAEKPEDYGLLFQWGRTDGYKFDDYDNNNFLSRKDYSTSSGKKYNDGDILNSQDDAAYIHMGKEWRMPTEKEINELLELKNEWIEQNGIKGRKFIGKNGNSIFIPAAGIFDGDDLVFDCAGGSGHIWSSSVYTKNYSYYLYLNYKPAKCYNYNHYFAFSVRGVCK